MKHKIKLLTTSFFLLISGVYSQENPILSYFNGQVFNDNIVLTWNIKDGDNCNGIIIYHSIDGQNFTEVGSIPGLCGAVDENEPYQFVHNEPKANQENYYKLSLGAQGFSSTLELPYYETGEKGFVFFPNPSSEIIQVYVNDVYRDATLEILDSSGKKVLEKKVNSGSIVSITLSSLKSANYILRLRNQNEVISTQKLIKL